MKTYKHCKFYISNDEIDLKVDRYFSLETSNDEIYRAAERWAMSYLVSSESETSVFGYYEAEEPQELTFKYCEFDDE